MKIDEARKIVAEIAAEKATTDLELNRRWYCEDDVIMAICVILEAESNDAR